ncbi:unnamed protein product [Colias eurytheme]|nr:unnamed protein product [Colias eurytheme]
MICLLFEVTSGDSPDGSGDRASVRNAAARCGVREGAVAAAAMFAAARQSAARHPTRVLYEQRATPSPPARRVEIPDAQESESRGWVTVGWWRSPQEWSTRDFQGFAKSAAFTLRPSQSKLTIRVAMY